MSRSGDGARSVGSSRETVRVSTWASGPGAPSGRHASRMPNDSSAMRSEAKPRASAEAESSHCASSTTRISGWSAAASVRRLKAAAATICTSRFGAAPDSIALERAADRAAGNSARRARNGYSSAPSTANGSICTDSTARVDSTRAASARLRIASRSAVLPIPGSPTSASARPVDRTTSSTKPSTTRSSRARPYSVFTVRPAFRGYPPLDDTPRFVASGGEPGGAEWRSSIR